MKNWYALAVVVCALTLGAARAEEKPKGVTLPEGIEVVSLKPEKTPGLERLVPGSRVDVVFRTTNPKTTVSLEDVLLLAVDTLGNGTVTYSVGVTKTQAVIVAALVGDGVKPTITLRPPPKK